MVADHQRAGDQGRVNRGVCPSNLTGCSNPPHLKSRGLRHAAVVLNGIKTVDGAKDNKLPKGRIALQYGQGIVRFRKVEIRPL
jgi:hypothetical protein